MSLSFKPFRLLNNVLMSTIAIGLVVGCSPQQSTSQVKVILPSAPSTTTDSAVSKIVESAQPHAKLSAFTANSGPSWDTTLNPSVGSDINCFAVFIGGGELNQRSCTVTDSSGTYPAKFYFGPGVALAPSSSAISIDAPSGDRVIYVVGFKSRTNSACSDIQNGTEPDGANLSEPFLLASYPVRLIAGANSVTVPATLNTSAKVDECTGMGKGSNTSSVPLFGTGADGSINISNANTIYSDVATLGSLGFSNPPAGSTVTASKIFSANGRITSIETAISGGKELTLQQTFTTDKFNSGDEIAWYVAAANSIVGGEGPDDACGGGLFTGSIGFATIDSVSPNTNKILLKNPITSSLQNLRVQNLSGPPINNVNFCMIMISRVPNFDQINIQANLTVWNSSFAVSGSAQFGGILAIRAKQINISSGSAFTLDASGTGLFTKNWGASTATQGTGLMGFPNSSSLFTSNYNGGGGGSSSIGGSGGGGAYGRGSEGIGSTSTPRGVSPNHCLDSVNNHIPCQPLEHKKAFWGGSGGSSTSAAGGPGGGGVIVFAKNIVGAASTALNIKANGGSGGTGGTAAGGGGGGGFVTFISKSRDASPLLINLSAAGGNAGTATSSGGGGGGGIINFATCTANASQFTGMQTNYAAGSGGISAAISGYYQDYNSTQLGSDICNQ